MAHWNPRRAILGIVGRLAGKSIHVPSYFEKRLQHWVQTSVDVAASKGRYYPTAQEIQKSFHPPSKIPSKAPVRRILSFVQLKQWAKAAPINRFGLPVVEFSVPRAMLQARLKKAPLFMRNIRKIAQIRSDLLENTPWYYLFQPLAALKIPPASPLFNH